ncbi:putative zinc protease [bacterium HR15]|nr:putative zinc protease [bacterium HR15]
MSVPTTPPPDHPIGELRLPLPEEHVLPNRLQLLMIPDARAPRVELRLIIPTAGRAFDEESMVGLAAATARLMTAGTRKRSSFQIEEEADRYGGALAVSANTEIALLQAHCLSHHLPQMIDLVADILLNPVFPSEEVEIDRANTLQRLRLQRTQPDFLADERLRRSLFGTHPYHRVAPDENALQRWQPEHLQAFHAQRYRPAGATLIVVGDFRTTRLVRLLETHLSAWQGEPPDDKLPSPPHEPAEKGEQFVSRDGSVQSHLMLGTLVPPRSAPDSLDLLLGVNLLGGGASSRLFRTVREQYGYAYSVNAHIDYYRRIGAFVAQAQTATDNTRDALRQILYEIDQLTHQPIPAHELQATKNYLIGRHTLGWITLGGIADRFVQTVVHRLPMDYWHRYPELVHAVSSEAVQQVCARYLQPERMSIVMVGDPGIAATETLS